MDKLTATLTGFKILETVESPINGKLVVIKDLVWGTHIKSGGLMGLTQSGGVAKTVWKTALRKVQSSELKVKSCLILGLGGGGIAEIVRDLWPTSKITGVDIDPLMVELGKKYMNLDKWDVDIKIGDAYEISSKFKIQNSKFDLVCIDIYVVDEYPEKFEEHDFLDLIKKLLSDGGVAVFNRLYYDGKRSLAEKFEQKLKKVFAKVERIYPEANVMFVCKRS